jgi:hypothetical protein
MLPVGPVSSFSSSASNGSGHRQLRVPELDRWQIWVISGSEDPSTDHLSHGRCAPISGLALDRMGGVGHGPRLCENSAR